MSEERSNARNRPVFAGGIRVSQLSTHFGPGPSSSGDGGEPSGIQSPTGNPLKYDPALISLMDKLDTVQSYRQFRKWKASFLRRFQSFLQQDGVAPAQTSYAAYSQSMEGLERNINRVRTMVEKGNLTVQKTTVKGRNALSEMVQTMNHVIVETESMIPATKAEEKRKQFTKYHLGAVLIEDGFLEYDRMVRCNDKTKELLSGTLLLGGLDQIADRQQLDAMERYDRQIQQFVDVMRDLGLHEVMVQCRKFLHGGSLEDIILLDPKTGAVMEIPRELLFQKGILTLCQDDQGAERIQEEEVSRAERVELAGIVRSQFGVA